MHTTFQQAYELAQFISTHEKLSYAVGRYQSVRKFRASDPVGSLSAEYSKKDYRFSEHADYTYPRSHIHHMTCVLIKVPLYPLYLPGFIAIEPSPRYFSLIHRKVTKCQTWYCCEVRMMLMATTTKT